VLSTLWLGILLAGSTLLPRPLHAAVTWPTLELAKVADGFDQPLHITHAGDGSDRLFVVERAGRIRILQDGVILDPPFLDITDRVTPADAGCNECGLLSVAFPPDFATAGYFFVYYTAAEDLVGPETNDPNGDYDTVVARFRLTADPNRADATSEFPILLQNQPYGNHNGGQLAFDGDGDLYIGLGDGGGGGDPANNAQDRATLLGKLLRVQVGATGTYTVPADNPFVGTTAIRPEIWAWGLRNPWRFAFDPTTDDLYIADVGQNKYEEINFQSASSPGGENYGWKIREGMHCYAATTCDTTGLTDPVAEYGRDLGSSVTGGVIYRSPLPGQAPIYLYGDFSSGRIQGLQKEGAEWRINEALLNTNLNISSFGYDEAGNSYVVDFDGAVYRLLTPVHKLRLPGLIK
jgi:glucose/arabinose dehydrogenase